MKRFFLFSLSLIASLVVASCTNIDELSDDNSIAEFSVLDHFPKIIEIGATEVEGDVIYIPIVYGQSKFPLRFYANLKITADIDKIVGIDFSKEQCLESIDDEIKFYVMAKSGLTRTYYIRARVVDPNDNNYLFSTLKLNGVSPKTIVSERATISTQGDTLKMYTVGGSYPITVKPEFQIDEAASFRNFENGATELKFDNERTTHKIKVISRNGAERLWNIKVINTPLIKGSDTSISEERRTTTSIDPREFSASISQAGYMVDEYFIDNANNEIVLKIKEDTKARAANVSFPLNVDIRFKTYDGVELFDITNETTITFPESYKDTKTFYMLDATDCVSRQWTIRLEEWIGSSADILSFSYDYSASNVKTTQNGKENVPSIVLDANSLEIYPKTGEIYIKATSIAYEWNKGIFEGGSPKKWKLTLQNITYKASKGATVVLPTFEWVSNANPGIVGVGKHDNDCWKTAKVFTVTAEDGTAKEWTLKIREPADNTKSDKAEINAFSVASVRPNYVSLDSKMPWILDGDNKKISIMLGEIEDKDYPLSIYPDYELSPYASITSQNNGTDPLIFDSATSTQTVSVTAQNGTTSIWTVNIVAPEKAVGADVEEFTIGLCLPSTFKATSSTINKEDRTIKIFIEGTGAFPITIDYSMVLSDKATASVPVRNGKFTFNNTYDSKPFTVFAQNGSKNFWQVKLDYRPKIEGGNIDSWSGNNPVFPWSSANNIFVTGTGNEDRAGNGKVAVLTSISSIEFAAGSLFLGKFEFDIAKKSDPISMTHFGVPFQATAKIKGILVDLNYTAGAGNFDYGSAVIELVNNTSSSNYEYHGTYPDGSGPKTTRNTAQCAARGEYFISNTPGKHTPIDNEPGTISTHVQTAGQWYNDVFVPIQYSDPNVIPTYTHLHIVFSSSALGAKFKGTANSRLKVDNVRLVYED